LPWYLVFVQKSNFQEKSRKILQKSYFTKRPTELEYETKRGWEATTPPGGAAQAWSRQGVVRPPQPSPQALLPPIVIQNKKLCSGTLPGWDLEDIFITDVSPSTIHDSPIHV
jgi:hypothetical protein